MEKAMFIETYGLESYVHARPQLDEKRIAQLDRLIANATLGIDEHVRGRLLRERLRHEFPALDMSFLGISGAKLVVKCPELRFQVTNPKFCVYGLDRPDFVLDYQVTVKSGKQCFDLDEWMVSFSSFNVSAGPSVRPELTKHLMSACRVVLKNDRHRVGVNHEGRSHSYTWNTSQGFGTYVPDDVRTIIRNETHRLDGMYIIAEAKEWNVGEPQISTDRDPLLVGHVQGEYFLLAEFECTDLEAKIATGFATKRNVGRAVS